MYTAFITEKERLEVRQTPIPEPGPGQVRVRVDYVGLCGSDLHYYFDGANGAFRVLEPLTPGHEMSGRVDLDPAGEWAPGTPVTLHPARFGEPQDSYPESRHLWPGGSYLGSAATNPHTQGALTQYLLVDTAMLRALPGSLPLRRAALAEPLGVALHAINKAGGVAGKRVLVAGAGPIGLLTIAAARALGAASIAATDVLPGPLQRAADLGAQEVYDVTNQEVPGGFDTVFECTGVPASLSTAFAATRPEGIVVLVGMMPAQPLPVVLAPIGTKELTIVGSFRFNTEVDDAIAFLDEHPELEAVITHDVRASDAASIVGALELARDSQASGKVLVQVWPEA